MLGVHTGASLHLHILTLLICSISPSLLVCHDLVLRVLHSLRTKRDHCDLIVHQSILIRIGVVNTYALNPVQFIPNKTRLSEGL